MRNSYRSIGRALIGALLLLTIAGVASAQNGYLLGRYSAEHSGAVSTGNGYTLVASMGQADAGTLSGGGFVLAGGFLAGAPVSSGPDTKIFLPRLGR